MTSRTRFWVLAISTPVIAFVVIGGYLGQAMTRNDTYPSLRVFEDVFSLVLNNYVEPVDVRQTMRGAMRGLADGLDAESTFLTPELVKAMETKAPLAVADIGADVTRQYYLRIISVREGSPAAKAGLRSGDFIRAIDAKSTRDMSPYEGQRLLHGAPGSKLTLLILRGNAADPHEVSLVRERRTGSDVTSRMANASTGYVRISEFTKDSPVRVKQAVEALTRSGASRVLIDLRGTSVGDLDDGLATARIFVKTGTLAVKQAKEQRDVVSSVAGDGALSVEPLLLVGDGTAGAAEVFAAALGGNKRAQLIGEHTVGRAARQRLVKLPDGSGLYLTVQRYLTPDSKPIHEKGLQPDIVVEVPDVEFGTEPPPGDPILERALKVVAEKAEKKAA